MLYFGVFFFLGVVLMAFWLLIFLLLVLPGVVTALIVEKFNPELAAKLIGAKTDDKE